MAKKRMRKTVLQRSKSGTKRSGTSKYANTPAYKAGYQARMRTERRSKA